MVSNSIWDQFFKNTSILYQVSIISAYKDFLQMFAVLLITFEDLRELFIIFGNRRVIFGSLSNTRKSFDDLRNLRQS